MGRSIRDDLKRKCAQAMNHLASAVLDVDDIRKAFQERAEKVTGQEPDYAGFLEQVEIATNANREALLQFAQNVWDLDEEGLMRYM